MIGVATARRLRDAGLVWEPGPGDRFVLADRGMDDEVFTLSDMTVEVHEFPTGPVIGFNGTTEWALDSVERDEALWLPREDQLRERLGDAFERLEVRGDLWRVLVAVDGSLLPVESDDPAEAYALALLELLTRHRAAAP